jgi:hypothetical protein
MAGKQAQRGKPPDGFVPPAGSELAWEHELLSSLLREHKESWTFQYLDKKDEPVISHIRGLKPEEQCRVIEAALKRGEFAERTLRAALLKKYGDENEEFGRFDEDSWVFGEYFTQMIDVLLRKSLPVDEALMLRLLKWSSEKHPFDYAPISTGLVSAFENFAKSQELSRTIRQAAEGCREHLLERNQKHERKLLQRLDAVIGTDAEVRLAVGEAWSDAAIEDLGSMKPNDRRAWHGLLAHCLSAEGGTPKKKWLAEANKLLEAVTIEDFQQRVLRWFPLVDKPRTRAIRSWSEWVPNPNLLIIDQHVDILKGLAWYSSLVNDDEIARLLTALAISAYKKVPGVGARAVKLGNACVYALGAMPGTHGLGQLAILKVRVKFGSAQKGIEKALAATAERLGIPREELEEMGVPAYGLTEVGTRTETLGEFTAELEVVGRKAELHWRKPDGKVQKSVPATVARDFAEDLKELKKSAKDIEKMLPAQAARIEQGYLEQREWKLPIWRERYLDHPLVGILARRLIWLFRRGNNRVAAMWSGQGFVDHRGKAVDWPDAETSVRLWHPLDEDKPERITAWRDWLMEHEIRQPFKQAYREIYLLTDAERNTRVYSNRFAAHVLKQHQFHALCGARNWKNTLRLMVDDTYPPAYLLLPSWNLRAEFWVEGAGDEYGIDTNETGTFLYLVTDQVRFYRPDAEANWAHAGGGGYTSRGQDRGENRPLSLEEIPPLVFSEVMRDVDLFVGVASVGNDPNWADGGPEGRYRDYWQSYSFGELGSTAGTRKEVLQRLVPRLKIADRCTFSERFLVVSGDIRTYRIHLGSGNILMEPNDEYLCIVPKQATAKGSDAVFLPFEGDGTMSIILSKALLLAEDTKIKDPTILRQIKR